MLSLYCSGLALGSWSVEIGEFSEHLWGKIPQENTRYVMVVVVSSSSNQDSPRSQADDMPAESLWQTWNTFQ